jgi:tRNA pseudouridine55 synthase
VNGLLIIDKPSGLTSHDVVQRVRRTLRTRRVGHAGTLDPMATGVLLVAVGDCTRLVEFLMQGEKSYQAVLKLGETTDTQDSEGEVLERKPLGNLGGGDIHQAAQRLTGTIHQLPPMYSALKRDGVPLYRLARQGIEVERSAREIVIHRLEIVEVHLPFVTLDVVCSKGTYIRTLCHDLGEILGTGAHMTSLRRTACSGFSTAEAHPLDRLVAEGTEASTRLLTLLQAMRAYPRLSLDQIGIDRLRNGIPPEGSSVSGVLPETGALVGLTWGEELRAVALFEPHRLEEKRGDFRLLRVFHSR